MAAWGVGGGVGAQETTTRRDVIVVLSRQADPQRVAREVGANPRYIYKDVINGFAAALPDQAIRALERLPTVELISPDRPVEALGRRWARQAMPTGVDRIDADRSSLANIDRDGSTVDADVAVLDTGIAAHPDLNIAGGVRCIGNAGYNDRDGHGTHVAGTIAAKDNRRGVVGVAPGARLWAVKVLDDNGSGSHGSVICGLSTRW